MRFIVENMLETIEIDQEKNAFVVEESDVQDEDHVDHVDLQDLQDDESQDSTDAKQQIDLLLGLTSVWLWLLFIVCLRMNVNEIESLPEPWKSHLERSQSLLDKNDVFFLCWLFY